MSRRGEGSIFKRKDGRWVAKIVARNKDGKSTQVTKYAPTRELALQELDALRRQYHVGGRLAGVQQKLSDFCEEFLKGEFEVATHAYYKSAIGRYIVPYLGTRNMGSIDPQTVQRWMNDLKEKRIKEEGRPERGIGARTRQAALSTLKVIFDRACELQIVGANPAAGVKRPKGEAKKVKPFTVAEVIKILAAVKGDRLEALYVLAFHTGMRQGELFGLQWPDIDWDAGLIRICRQVVEVRGKVYIKTPKTSSGFRVVGLTPECVHALKHRQSLARNEGFDTQPWVFLNVHGGLIHRSNFGNRQWKPLLRTLGLAERGMHHSRHTVATMMLNAKLSAHLVAGIIGHSNPSTTMDIYGHLIEGDHAVASEAIRATLSGVTVVSKGGENKTDEEKAKEKKPRRKRQD